MRYTRDKEGEVMVAVIEAVFFVGVALQITLAAILLFEDSPLPRHASAECACRDSR